MSAHFATTRWSLVRNASTDANQRREALGDLYTLYWRPICDYLRRMGVPDSEVEDVAQDFFVGFFDSQALDRADQEYGRFRAYLVGALRHQVLKHRRKLSTQKRGGGTTTVPLETLDTEPQRLHEDHARLFDLEWAQVTVQHSMQRLLQETERQGLTAEFTAALVHGDIEISQRDLASKLGVSTTALKTRVFRLRRRFREILREEVTRTVLNKDELDAEMAYLLQVLGGSPA